MRVHKQNLLNAQQIKHAKPGKLNDGGGLIVETKPVPTKNPVRVDFLDFSNSRWVALPV